MEDPVASRFHELLSQIPERLSAYKPVPRESPGTPPNGYLLIMNPDGPQDHLKLSVTLLIMLCQPFGEPSHQEHAEANIKTCERLDPGRYEISQLVERIEWDFGRKSPFKWDPAHLDFGRRR